MTDIAEFSRVISEIYDAAVIPHLWPNALSACCAFLDAFRANLFWHDAAAVEAGAFFEFNEDPTFTKLYVEKYVALNPMFPAAAFLKPGQIVGVSDLVPRDEFRKTRFYEEWVRPQGILATFGAMLENEALSGSYVSFHWEREIDDEETRQNLKLLVPHLQRAVAIGRLFAGAKRREGSFSAALDRVDSPILLLASRGRVIFANAAARVQARQGDLLSISRDVLTASNPLADRQLKQGLLNLENRTGLEAAGVTVTLSDAPDHRWIANVLPLVDGVRQIEARGSDAIAAVFIRNSQFAVPTPLETIADRYKLTASELRVLDAVTRVSGLDAIAEALGISRATVKTHLNHIYRKTDAKKLSDLVKLVMSLR